MSDDKRTHGSGLRDSDPGAPLREVEKSRPYSSPPLSVRPLPIDACRRYEDPELLARAWQRLEADGVSRARRGSGGPSSRQVLAAAALFVLGVGVGRWSGLVGVLDEASETGRPSVASETGMWARPELSPTTRTDGLTHERNQDSPDVGLSPRLLSHRARGTGRDATHLPAPPAVSGEAEGATGAEGLVVVPASAAPPVARPGWLILAERGDFAGAFSELEQDGSFEAVLQASSAEELMTLADVARFAGREGRAILALRQVTQRHQDDPNAPLAAMMLGNLLQRAGDRAGAAAAYALNRTLSPDGDFAEDALVRELDLMLAEPNLERALELFQKYQIEFPSGARLATLRARVDALRAAQASAVAERPGSSGTEADDEPAETADTSAVPSGAQRTTPGEPKGSEPREAEAPHADRSEGAEPGPSRDGSASNGSASNGSADANPAP